jgi:HK97 family phage prohead protease
MEGNLESKTLAKPNIVFKDAEDGQPTGEIEAVFSVFGVRDHDGDVIMPNAIKDQSKVAIAWGHDWSKTVGKGQVHVDGQKATLKGKFFLDTQAGNEAYKTVRNMGADQEWSWGFIAQEMNDADPDMYNGRKTREITKVDIFEVSPVLRGANPMTETVAIKQANNKTFADHCDEVLDAVETLVERAESLADLRAKEGRKIGEMSKESLALIAEKLRLFKARLENVTNDNIDEYGSVVEQVQHDLVKNNLRINDLKRRTL